ncbi:MULTISPECIES: flavodoxin domain-containing protein [Streptomyces]|uniref:flavodoxin domain-containing protein n=1 Tax=Streptomyces TaxID=1883 RepID=UPI001D1429B2|nr:MULTISPECIES: flavodoxin domain-containing protein [Streptomyces]MCC3655371.1 flavodoxin [Streptomyces sp. S07_1.15]WSQ70312.1 flavodoxin [Streptomyces xinghaiensis]
MPPNTRENGAAVLVAYASEHGSTREIAERIAGRLTRAGHRAEARPVDGAVDPDPGRYDAVVVGSAVHNQQWMPEASGYVRRHRAELGNRPVWLFSVGMSAALGRPLRSMASHHEPKNMPALRDEIHPVGTCLFSGAVRRGDLPPAGHAAFKAMGGHYGDYRDWDRIEAWADEIAHRLPEAQAA